MIARVREDLAAARHRDPAARGGVEVALLYPGLHAIWAHRLWHALWLRRMRFWRLGFDLAFPPLVLTAAVVVTPWLFVTGHLADPKGQGAWAGVLVTLAGILWGRGRAK